MKDDTSSTQPFVAPEIAKGLEQSQIGKYHTKGGTGFAAEDANAFADRVRGKKVDVTGTSNEKNGADRIVNGVPVQTKFYSTASSTVESAFDSASGMFRYDGQLLEVPQDQYDECVRIMRDKISAGKVSGVTDPSEAERIVKKASVTYKQARNIARAGNIDSLLFDVKTQSVTTAYVFAVTFAVQYSKLRWDNRSNEEAIKGALEAAIAAGGVTLVTGIIAAQVLRTRVAALGVVTMRNGVRAAATTSAGKKTIERLAQASLGKAVYGAAAVNHVSKLLRSNLVTSTIATAVTSTPDFCRAAFSKSISWPQFTKNLLVNAGGVAGGTVGWMGGAAAGAAIGSAIPIIGTAAGGLVGGIIGALGGGWAGTSASKGLMDVLVEDDAKRMIDLLKAAVEELAGDYLLSESEIEGLSHSIKGTVDAKWLRSMYQSGSDTGSCEVWRKFAYDAFDSSCQEIIAKRPKITLPAPELVEAQIAQIVASAEKLDGDCDEDPAEERWDEL